MEPTEEDRDVTLSDLLAFVAYCLFMVLVVVLMSKLSRG
jgi:hypothetical protein